MIASLLGVRLHPWQRYALDVAGELVEDPDTGLLVNAYDEVIVPVPRRAGKSLLILLVLLRLATEVNRARGFYTAQSRADAAVTMLDDWMPDIQDAKPELARMCEFRKSNGSEAVRVPAGAASFSVFAPRPKALHGRAADLIAFDEGWAFPLDRGDELEIAARPTMATRPGAQTWKLSAAGDIDSTWWIHLLEIGRSAAAADTGRGICHLEWTADFEGLDPADELTWLFAHPAIRSKLNPHGTITLDFLRAEWARNPAQFLRLYLNIMDRDGTKSSPLDEDRWAKLTAEWDRTGGFTVAVDSSPDQAFTAIVACGKIEETPVVEMIRYDDGIFWAVDELVALSERYPIDSIAIDPQAPAGALITMLENRGIIVRHLVARDVTAAAAQLVGAVRTGDIRHIPSPVLDTAIAAARRRKIGDGAWAFLREGCPPEVCALIAASFARYTRMNTAVAAIS